MREDTEKFEVELSNLHGGCGARFKSPGSHVTLAHIQDASPADAPLEQALQDGVITPYGTYTTDGHNLEFRIELSHQVDEAVVVGYETVEQYNRDRKWEAKKNRNYHHRSGKVTFPARDESLYRVVKVPTTHRGISQPQLIQSVQLKVNVRRGPGKVSSSRVTGLIYDQHHTGPKSVTQAPQQYDPTPSQPTPTPVVPTPTPIVPTTENTPKPEPGGEHIEWGVSEVVVTEGALDGDHTHVDVPFNIPQALARHGWLEIGLSHTEDGNIPTSTIRDLRLMSTGSTYHPPDRPTHVVRLPFERGQEHGMKIKLYAPQDGKVESDEVMWLTVTHVENTDKRAGQVYWRGKKSVKVTIKDQDTVPGVVPRIDFLPHPNIFPSHGGFGYEVLERDDKWTMTGTVTFDSPLPAPATVHAIVRCKICANKVNRDGDGDSHKTKNYTPIPISLPAGATQATFSWPMLGNTRVNHGWTMLDRILIFGLNKIDGDVFVMDPEKLSADNPSYDYELLPKGNNDRPFGANVPILEYTSITIREDDHESSLSLQGADPQVEGLPLKFTVQRNGDTSQAVTLNYETVVGTATEGIDYVASTGSLTIAANESNAVIEVETFRDLFTEAAETVGLRISSETPVQKATAQGTIIDLGNLADAVQMSLGKPEASQDGTAVFVPVCIDFERVVQGKLQDMHFQWGVSDDKSVKNAQTAVAAPPRKTCLGYITLSSK